MKGGYEDTGIEDELAAKNIGKVQKRQDTKRGYQKGAGTTGHIGRQLRKRRLTWFGHVTRMEGNRLPVVALYGQVEETRSRGRQPKKWIDNVKEDITAQGMNMREAVDNSRNRRIWRSLVEASSSANGVYKYFYGFSGFSGLSGVR